MFLHAKQVKAIGYEAIDLDTGLKIPRVAWAEDKTGIYCQFDLNDEGLFFLDHLTGRPASTIKKGRILLRKVGS